MGSCIHNKPKWKPMYWDNLREQDLKITNCYAYAFNVVDKNSDPNNDHKIQPGEISNSLLENELFQSQITSKNSGLFFH